MNKFISFGDIADFRNGLNFSKESHGKGCLLIGVADFKDNFKPQYETVGEINPVGAAKEDDYLKKGDLIFVRSNGNKALVGRSMFIDKEVKALYSGFCIRSRLKDDIIDPQFLAYFAKSEYFRKSIAQADGTNINNLNQGILSAVKLPIFERSLQNRIVETLSWIDEKIELNNQINAELEAMTKLIYDYWFVQFDFPDANGKPYKSSGGKMVYNKELKREIPAGWDVGTLLDIATFTNGIACQKHRPIEGEDYYKVIKIREMSAGFTEKSEFVSKRIPEKVVVNNGDVLFSWSATLDVKIWAGGKGGLNQHIFKVTSKKYPRTYYYFEVLRYLQHFKMIAELRKTTMGHITQDHLKQSRIPIAPERLIDSLHMKLEPIIEKIVSSKEGNIRLEQLRDWLLPMLMNGQVTVK
jgi:type I restriction enzyme S subunit|tara:strand:+ start:15541 stop:16773 length:1233 start_codon:yes stop_codon:yes gene_type:complete